MSEIDEDLKISKLEISNNLGITLSSENARIKHTGEGDLNILSNNIFINGGFVGNYEILDSNGNASLKTLTTFLNASNLNLNISLEAGQLGQIKNFVFYTNGVSLANRVYIRVINGIRTLIITLNNPGSTVSLLCSPVGITTFAWSIIGGYDYTVS